MREFIKIKGKLIRKKNKEKRFTSFISLIMKSRKKVFWHQALGGRLLSKLIAACICASLQFHYTDRQGKQTDSTCHGCESEM